MKVREAPTPGRADTRGEGWRPPVVVPAVQAVVLGGVAVVTLLWTRSPEAVPIVVAPLVLAFHQDQRWRRLVPVAGRRRRGPAPSTPGTTTSEDDEAPRPPSP